MTDIKQQEALLIAEQIEPVHSVSTPLMDLHRRAASELRRLHALNLEWHEKAATWLDSPESAQRLAGYQELAQRLNAVEQQRYALCDAIKKLHAAKGRYHTQIAACDLYDLCNLKNERPTK